jgi:hypothetical protein
MDIKKLFIGGITGGILYFFLGWLVYGNLLQEFMKANPGKVTGIERAMDDFNWMYLVIGNLVSGLLLAFIFVKGNVNTLVNGLVTGAIVGMLMSIAFDTMMYATTNIISKKMMLADVLAAAGMGAVVGAIVGLVLGKLNKAA